MASIEKSNSPSIENVFIFSESLERPIMWVQGLDDEGEFTLFFRHKLCEKSGRQGKKRLKWRHSEEGVQGANVHGRGGIFGEILEQDWNWNICSKEAIRFKRLSRIEVVEMDGPLLSFLLHGCFVAFSDQPDLPPQFQIDLFQQYKMFPPNSFTFKILKILLLSFGHFFGPIWAIVTPSPNPQIRPWNLQNLLHQVQGPVPLCSPDSIGILLPNPTPMFPTLLYANRYRNEQPRCSQPFPVGAPLLRLDIQLTFGFPCGVHSRRMTMPRVGLEHSIRLVLGMNPNGPNQTVVTTSGQQRIFDIRCQYFADRNQTIGRVLELSAMSGTFLVEEPPEDIQKSLGKNSTGMGRTQQQPECKYSIHANSIEGPRANRVQIGDRVFHRWRCGDEYALKVYRCFVHDGRNRRHQIINERGCSTDLSLMPHPQYSANLSHVIAPSRVFRFNSSPRVFFDCLLYACLKNDPECRRATTPKCSNGRTMARRRRRRRRRQANEEFLFSSDGQQVVAPPKIESVAVRLEMASNEDDGNKFGEHQLRLALLSSKRAVKALAILNLISLVTAIILGFALCCQRRRFNTRLAISPKQRR